MKDLLNVVSRPVLGLLALALVLPFGACDEYEPPWFVIVDTTSLYSLARSEYMDLPSGYDFAARSGVVIERPKPGNPFDFDMAVTEIDGEVFALPAGMFSGFDVNPGIAIDSSGTAFDDVVLAPSGGYVTDEPVPLRTGWLYFVRTRRDFQGCSHYGKFTVLEVDPAGVVDIQATINPHCNDRDLIPPDDD